MLDEHKKLLLKIAKQSIKHGLERGVSLKVNLEEYPPELKERRATFVTLKLGEELRGCIGMLEAIRPLVTDVADNAFSAAFRDPRFSPVTEKEFLKLKISLSLLSIPEPLVFKSEDDLLTQIRPGTDGLILEDGGHRGTFLPSVWEAVPHPKEFLEHLKQKAGLAVDYWSKSITIKRYTTDIIE